MQTSNRATALTLYILLCLIWGSSFVLMKIGLFNNRAETVFTPYQLAALRMTTAGLAALPLLKKALPILKNGRCFFHLLLSALLGSFIPAFLFCIAETKVDSSVAGMLNATTPIFATIIGLLFFTQTVRANQVAGIAVGLLGCILLALGKQEESIILNKFSLIVVAATICYGTSINIVKSKLGQFNPLHLTAAIFILLLPLSIAALWFAEFLKLPLSSGFYKNALLAGSALGIIGTALATVIFYRLVALSGVIFSSMVTYGIPIVAIGWSLIYGESVTLGQIGCLIIILFGVFLSSWDTLKKQFSNKKSKVD